MPKPSLHENKKRLLPVLWQLFLSKLERAWKREHKTFPTDLNDPINEEVLATCIHDHMKASLGASLLPLSPADIASYLQQDGLTVEIPAANLTALLLYLGFQDWEDFQKQYAQEQPNEKPSTEKSKKGTAGFGFNDLPYFGPVILLLYYPFFLALNVL